MYARSVIARTVTAKSTGRDPWRRERAGLHVNCEHGSDHLAAGKETAIPLAYRNWARRSGSLIAVRVWRIHPNGRSARIDGAMKIAIVGTGVSGLVAAHLLHREHEIIVYEAGERVGGHSQHGPGRQRATRPTGSTPASSSSTTATTPTSKRCWTSSGSPASPRTWASRSPTGAATSSTPARRAASSPVPSHLLSPSFLGMLRDWRRFNREARALIGMNGTAPSLGHWLEEQGFSRHFVERLIVPQASAVWSADPEQMWSFPASFMAEFFDNHGMFSLRDRPRWRTVSGGSRSYVEAITAPWRDRIRLRAPVRSIERLERRRADRGRRLRERGLRRGRDRHPLRPGAGDARRPERGRARDPRRDPLPAQRGRAPHRRLAAAAPPQPPGRAGTSTSPSRPASAPPSPTG